MCRAVPMSTILRTETLNSDVLSEMTLNSDFLSEMNLNSDIFRNKSHFDACGTLTIFNFYSGLNCDL